MNLLLVEASDFVDDATVELRDRRHAHLRQVLRAKPGDSVWTGRLGGAMGCGTLIHLDERVARIEVRHDQEPPTPPPVRLVLALPRPKVLRRVLQCATCFGVKEVAVTHAFRVEKSYWQSPMLDAAAIEEQLRLGLEQARDTLLPRVTFHRFFRPFVEDILPGWSEGACIVAHPGDGPPAPRAWSGPVTLAVGPEGGWIPFEVDLLQAQGFQRRTLGSRLLRVEHAVPALLSRAMELA